MRGSLPPRMVQRGRSDDSLVILNRPWVHALVLILATILAFGPGLEGELVWDDPITVGSAAALASPAQAFSTSLFASSSEQLAQYYRPLVTLSYWVDLQLFSTSPHIGLHLVNLLWHALAAVFVLLSLRRWLSARGPGPAQETQRNVACLVAALLWAVLPQKAECVAWISGRADPMGLALLLAGLTVRARLSKPWARLVAASIGVILALLCKESFVVAPIIVAIELWSEAHRTEAHRSAAHDSGAHDSGADSEEPLRVSVVRLLRRPELLAAAGIVLAYLAFRSATFPIRGGGQANVAGLALVDRASLFAETLGHAFVALLTPQHAVLLRGPVGFRSPTELLREPAMAVWGTAFLAIALVLAWRVRAARPAAFLLLTLLPVSNLVPSGLESRFSDRFLYMPTLALALGVAIAVVHLNAKAFRIAVLVGFIGTGMLSLRARERSALFTSNDTLFGWERRQANRAVSVLQHAATAAAEARRYRESRDLRFEVVDRYLELGYGGEGYEDLVTAIRMQVAATGESHRPSMFALQQLLRALTKGGDQPVTEVPLDDGRVIGVPVATPQALDFAVRKRLLLRVWLAQLDVRMGELTAALEEAKAIVEACPNCGPILIEASQVAMMLGEPTRALEWLARVPRPTRGADELEEVARLQAQLLSNPDKQHRVAGLFLGQSFSVACFVAKVTTDANDPDGTAEPVLDIAGAASCWLTGNGGVPEAFARLDGPAREAKAVSLRNDPVARRDLVAELFGLSISAQ